VKETWGFVWFAAALCVIVLVSLILGSVEAAFPAFFCFLPVVFYFIALTIKNLTERISRLESALKNGSTTS